MRDNFRVWQGEELTYFTFGDVRIGIIDPTGYGVFDSKLMQYIGLKDKNGTEIYEGDIFEDYNGAKYVVEFDEDYGGFLPFTSDDGCGCCSSGMTGRDSESGEVVGNIYENPDWREEK